MGKIDATARVADGATIAEDVEIGPYCIVGPHVELGPGVRLLSHVSVTGHTSIGARTVVYPFASLGTPPQSVHYRGGDTRLVIGADCQIREGCTANTGTEDGRGVTRIGDGCFMMVGSHIAHDCDVGNHVTFANNAVLAGHVSVGLVVGRRVPEVAESVDDLLRRSATDSELQATARDEIGGAGIFDHVKRVLVAHVDDGRPDLDALGASADRRQERERRGKLLGEVVDAEVGTVSSQVLDRLGELDRLDERVRARADHRIGRRRPMPERQEADLLHTPILGIPGEDLQGRVEA